MGLHRLILKHPASFMISLARWHNYLLFKTFMIVIYPQEMKIYKEKTDRKTAKGIQNLLGVMKTTNILLYTLLIKWYLQHDLRLTAVQEFIEYKPCKSFPWFSEEVANARREADKDLLKNKWLRFQN